VCANLQSFRNRSGSGRSPPRRQRPATDQLASTIVDMGVTLTMRQPKGFGRLIKWSLGCRSTRSSPTADERLFRLETAFPGISQ
jgi:hypothetical protein